MGCRGPWTLMAVLAFCGAIVAVPSEAIAQSPPPEVRGFDDLPVFVEEAEIYPADLSWRSSDDCATAPEAAHATSPPKVLRDFCWPVTITFTRAHAYVAVRMTPRPFRGAPNPQTVARITLQAYDDGRTLVDERALAVAEGATTSVFLADPQGRAVIRSVSIVMIGDYLDFDDLAFSPFPQPDGAITGRPPDLTRSDAAELAFTGPPGATFECALDGAATSCSSPHRYGGVTEGRHTFSVTAVDSYGARDATPAVATWTVDRTPPDTAIDDGPFGPGVATAATLRFSSTDPAAGFECRLNAGAFAPCASPFSVRGLSVGRQAFDVRALDAAGNVDATPAQRVWDVRRDRDDDGVADGVDNCPEAPNPAQSDRNADRIGDACEPILPKRTTIAARWLRVVPGHLVRFVSLKALEVPRNATVRFRCSGGGCPARRQRRWRARRADPSRSLTPWVRAARLRPGAFIDVQIRRRGFVGVGKRYCVRRGKRVQVQPYRLDRPSPRCGR